MLDVISVGAIVLSVVKSIYAVLIYNLETLASIYNLCIMFKS